MMLRIRLLILALSLGLVFLFLLFLLVALPVRAGDLTVLNTNDSGVGSLRQTIANAVDGDTILFDNSLSGQTITLTSGELLITKNLTISGLGANLLAISGNNNSRIFNITSTVTISGVTIKEGSARPPSTFILPAHGGGIYNSGTVNLTNSTVSSNSASGGPGAPGGDGGGIFNTGTLTLTNSTVSGNMAFGRESISGVGGGIFNTGTLTLINSTVSSNSARSFLTFSTGGGIFNSGTLTLTNSTVSHNVVTTSFGDGGGISSGGTTTLANTILANNQVGGSANDCSGTLTSGGYNLVEAPNNCIFSAPGDITNTDSLLGPLADNGGNTLTHALFGGSPAIDKIPNGTNGCGTTITSDQRGDVRPQGVGCDIGAYEGVYFYFYLPLIFDN